MDIITDKPRKRGRYARARYRCQDYKTKNTPVHRKDHGGYLPICEYKQPRFQTTAWQSVQHAYQPPSKPLGQHARVGLGHFYQQYRPCQVTPLAQPTATDDEEQHLIIVDAVAVKYYYSSRF